MQQAQAIGVYADGTGGYGIWVQCKIRVSDKVVSVETKGQPIFETLGDANIRAAVVWASLGGDVQGSGIEFCPLDFSNENDRDGSDKPYIAFPGDLDDEPLQAPPMFQTIAEGEYDPVEDALRMRPLGEDSHLEQDYEDRQNGGFDG